MNEYDFSTLNDKDFEVLVKDLLNAEYDLQLQHFKRGKDKGIDLRFSTHSKNNSVIVQAKHFLLSGYSQLKSILKSKELDKIKKLNPNRYIVATSISLSASQKDEIKEILAPFILTSNDIIGKEDLNGYLAKHPLVEKNHFKLWFSSTHVIKSILNNAIEGRTKYFLEKIKNNVKYYVVTNKLDEGNEILMKEKLLLITGQPGIGKTTLAELLILKKAYSGYEIFQVENISEAETIISLDNDKLQLFYFDDFLGANYSEIINAYKTETQLTRFVERVKNTPNKLIILTTRTIILNQAIQRYEKISHSSLSSNQFELKLNDYNKYQKALILYNHIYFRGLRLELFEIILNEKFYNKIIAHRNYTPRLIEFITDITRTKNILADKYQEFILLNLNNPKEIWRSSFSNQIEYLDKCLLLTLFSFEKVVFEKKLFNAYQERLKYEITTHNQNFTSNQFQDSIKVLLNGFIYSNLYSNEKNLREYTFINPSLTDFLLSYIENSESEKKAIISSILYVEQLQRFNPAKNLLSLSPELQQIIKNRIITGSILVKDEITTNDIHSTYAATLCRYCYSIDIDKILFEHLSAIQFQQSWHSIIDNISFVFYSIWNSDLPQTIQYIKDNFQKIAEHFILSIDEIDLINEIPDIFKLFDQNYNEFVKSEKGQEILLEVANTILFYSEENLLHTYKHQVTSMDEVYSHYDELDSIENSIKTTLFHDIDIDFNFKYTIDESIWIEYIKENQQDDDYEDYRNYKNNPSYEERNDLLNEGDMIDNLFSGE